MRQAMVCGSLISITGLLAGCILAPPLPQLGAPLSFTAGRFPVAAIPADVNGDGRIDLVVTRRSGGGELSVLLGNGDGTFREAMSAVGHGAPRVPCVADFNNDGKLDIAVTDFAPGGTLSLFFGRGDGSFSEPVATLVGKTASSPKVGDFNGDGKPDLVLVKSRPEGNDTAAYKAGQLVVLLGHGDGSFEPARAVELGEGPYALAVGDFNGDQLLDVAVADERNRVYIMLGAGNGEFPRIEPMQVGFQPEAVSVADLNRDGIADLVLGVPNGVSVLLGTGDGHFQRSADYPVEQTRSGWTVDLDRDGNLDLVTAHRVLINDGSGRFVQYSLPHRFADDSFAAAADFNGDGWPDVVTTDAAHGQINIYINCGGKSLSLAHRAH